MKNMFDKELKMCYNNNREKERGQKMQNIIETLNQILEEVSGNNKFVREVDYNVFSYLKFWVRKKWFSSLKNFIYLLFKYIFSSPSEKFYINIYKVKIIQFAYSWFAECHYLTFLSSENSVAIAYTQWVSNLMEMYLPEIVDDWFVEFPNVILGLIKLYSVVGTSYKESFYNFARFAVSNQSIYNYYTN